MHPTVTEAIVLAGGLGTRLRAAVPDTPKCMAPVAGHPFLYHVINHLQQQGIERFIFSLGYMGDIIEMYVQQNHPAIDAVFVTEDSPLGTGGAIQLASGSVITNPVLVVNGDTLFKINLRSLTDYHHQQAADCTLALKPMTDTDRYSMVTLDAAGRIVQFAEKKKYSQALINGGAYLLDIPQFKQAALPPPFSFETDYLEKMVNQRRLFGQVQDAYFIDIGVPEDYERAGDELMG